jgi:hypothetical protein
MPAKMARISVSRVWVVILMLGFVAGVLAATRVVSGGSDPVGYGTSLQAVLNSPTVRRYDYLQTGATYQRASYC